MTATDEGEDEELLLDTTETATEETIETPAETTGGTRTWLTRDETAEEAAPEPRQAGTLFERMSSIARGAHKAQVPEEEDDRGDPAPAHRHPRPARHPALPQPAEQSVSGRPSRSR